jgi:DNA replication protein DnaC
MTRRRNVTEQAAAAAIEQGCRMLRLPTIRDRFAEIGAAAEREQLTYLGFLSELVIAECDDRTRRRAERRVRDAGFPRPKRLEEFFFEANPAINPAVIGQLTSCAWVKAGHPLCLIGDPAPARATCSSRWAPWPPRPATGSATRWPASWSTNWSKPPTTSN